MSLVNKYRGYILFLGYTYILCFTVWSFGRSFGPDGKSGFFLEYGIFIQDLFALFLVFVQSVSFGDFRITGKILSVVSFLIFGFYFYLRVSF